MLQVKKALIKAIVALATRGNADDGKDFIEFLVKHCCPHPMHTVSLQFCTSLIYFTN